MDLFQKCRNYTRVKQAKEMGIYPYFRCLTTGQGPEVEIEGRHTYMFGSNNYMGLTADPRVKQAAIEAIEKYGTGCSGSRFLNGNLDIHGELERELASFLRQEACITFSTGFQSNLAILSSIAGRGDFIVADALNHASLVDGARLSFAKTLKYRHSDMDDLEKKLRFAAQQESGGILIVTDGVFSMEGDICRLPEIVELAKRYEARVLVDDAHALGVLGEGGRGTASHFGLESEVDLIMNTFSKTLASLGGCVAGKAEAVHFIQHTARPFIFSASIPPAQVAAARKALEILQQEPWRVERLHAIVRKMKALCRQDPHIQLLESENDCVPILPLLTGTVGRTLFTGNELVNHGVYVNPVFPPVVPQDRCLLRVSFMATHTDEQLERGFEILSSVYASIAKMDTALFDIDF